MATILKRIVLTLLACGCVSSIAFGGITKNTDRVHYDFFYYQEPLLDLVNDVRRLSSKNILFKPANLKAVDISYGREKVELMSSFTEALDIYGFGFKRMADDIFMIERIRSVEEVEASLLGFENSEGEEDSSSTALLAVANTILETNTAVKMAPPAFKVSKSSDLIPDQQGAILEPKMENRPKPVVNGLDRPDFIREVAGFQRRYIQALIAEGFTKEEAMKMAMGFNPVSLVPSEEMQQKP